MQAEISTPTMSGNVSSGMPRNVYDTHIVFDGADNADVKYGAVELYDFDPAEGVHHAKRPTADSLAWQVVALLPGAKVTAGASQLVTGACFQDSCRPVIASLTDDSDAAVIGSPCGTVKDKFGLKVGNSGFVVTGVIYDAGKSSGGRRYVYVRPFANTVLSKQTGFYGDHYVTVSTTESERVPVWQGDPLSFVTGKSYRLYLARAPGGGANATFSLTNVPNGPFWLAARLYDADGVNLFDPTVVPARLTGGYPTGNPGEYTCGNYTLMSSMAVNFTGSIEPHNQALFGSYLGTPLGHITCVESCEAVKASMQVLVAGGTVASSINMFLISLEWPY